MTKFENFSNLVIHLLAYEDGTECCETSAYKIQTPGNYPEENIQQTLTLGRLMSYIYIYIYRAPIIDVSRSHNDAAQSVGLLWTSDQLVAETST